MQDMIQAKHVYRVMRIALSATILVLALFLFYRFRLVSITPGCDSAAPEYFHVERVIADRFPMWRDRLDIGDVVVYEALDVNDARVRYFAAVGAGPGDAIENRGDRLWVEGEASDYPAVDAATGHDVVPEGFYLLFNTNPASELADSRVYGFVDRRAIFGRVGAVLPF